MTITGVGKPGATATFCIGDIDIDLAMTESTAEAGTYTGEFTPLLGIHPDGTYDVVVKIDMSILTVTNGVVIDNTALTLTEVTADATTIRNGQTFTLTVKGISGIQVSAHVSAVDTTQPAPVVLNETEPGTYSAPIVISEDNTADNGPKTITINAIDTAGNPRAIAS